CGADPAVRSNCDLGKLAVIRSQDMAFGVARMLPPTTKNLDATGDLRPIADRGSSQYAVSAEIHTPADPGLGIREERAELDTAIERALSEGPLVVRDPQVISQ